MSFEIISVVGPTASGKSELAIAIAEQLGDAEIINTDAMQVYQGMDIGTAKLTEPEMQGIPHHLISQIPCDQELSAVEFRELFDRSFMEISARGKQVVTVGGSTLYLSAALDELSFAPTDPKLRAVLEAELAESGQLNLWRRLQQIDPSTAEKIPASNPRRVVRALEVISLTGAPYSNSLPEPKYRRPTIQLGILVPREILNERIRQRVEKMWQLGLVREVADLQKKYPRLSKTAARAIGYRQAADQLAGVLTEEEAIAETTLLTTRYAKKQMTWFRRDKRIHWLDFSEDLISAAMRQIRLER